MLGVFQDRLVRVRGKVSIVDGDDTYVDATPVAYGLYKDTVHIDTRYLTTRLIPGDLVDLVGFVDGTVKLVGDIPDMTAVRATVR